MGKEEVMDLRFFNVRSLIRSGAEDIVAEYISTFSCEKDRLDGTHNSLNPDIEDFLQNNAIQFSRMKTAITYLLIDKDDSALLGYFTVAHKPLIILADGISRKAKDKIKRFSTLDETTNSYTVSAFLIAQFAKNYNIENGERISGKQLMNAVKEKLRSFRDQVGGTLAYLDCEPNAELIKFYESEGFTLFGERISENDGKRYLQYLTFI